MPTRCFGRCLTKPGRPSRPSIPPQRDIAKDDLHQQVLFLLFVFECMNSEIWYEVNPVLRTLERFRR